MNDKKAFFIWTSNGTVPLQYSYVNDLTSWTASDWVGDGWDEAWEATLKPEQIAAAALETALLMARLTGPRL